MTITSSYSSAMARGGITDAGGFPLLYTGYVLRIRLVRPHSIPSSAMHLLAGTGCVLCLFLKKRPGQELSVIFSSLKCM